jgi:uncharacterized protein YegP (UPF0339 family)
MKATETSVQQPSPKPQTPIEPTPTNESKMTENSKKPIEPKINEPIKKVPVLTESEKSPTSTNRYSGKYEVYPEAGGFKFRLKASNGEILVVSQVYASKAGAISGIETFKKNVETGIFEFYTDKSNYTQLLIYTPNKSRLIATGEFYESVQRSNSAADSVKKFYATDKVATLESIDPSEVREEIVELKPIEANASGKFEILVNDNQTSFSLKASNGEVLFVSSGYSSKASAMQGLDVVKKAIEAGSFRVKKDKQGRYQFEIYAANKSLLITGETYPNKDSCLSALDSVRRFYQKAKIVE